MRPITRKASLAVVELPSLPVDPKFKACPAFHIKGMCNTGCGNMTYHVVYTLEQDHWCTGPIHEIGRAS